MVVDCPGTVQLLYNGSSYIVTCDVPWTPAPQFQLLPPLSIEDGLLIAASIIGLLAIGYGYKHIGRLISKS